MFHANKSSEEIHTCMKCNVYHHALLAAFEKGKEHA